MKNKICYVILDLEWNNAFFRKRKRNINEIIEIGAVKLDSQLYPVDTFESFVNTSIGKKLNERVEELTNISIKDLETGLQFNDVMSMFRKWIGRSETVILTWSMSDIRVLMDNFEYFSGTYVIPFMRRYVDLQEYVQKALNYNKTTQLGLVSAAEILGIKVDDSIHHRALYDSMISAKCLQKTFNPECFQQVAHTCGDDFYAKLRFKPYYITDLDNPAIGSDLLMCTCPYCKNQMNLVNSFFKKNNSLKGRFYCTMCTNEYILTLKVKRKYDSVSVRRRVEFADESAG